MYPFLSQPPQPSTKKRTTAVPAPLSPSRNHPTAISVWASRVHPGSPAPCSPLSCASSPRSPHKRGRKPSLTLSHRRRSSVSQRTPSTAEYRPDLTAFGYNSLFVQFDKTPSTPSPFRPRDINTRVETPLTSDVFGSIPIPQTPVAQPECRPNASVKKSGPLKRFRSLSILRSKKAKSKDVPPSIPSPTKKSKGNATKKPANPKATAPPTLASDIMLMQFMGGGTVEDNVKKVMEARSKGVSKSGGAVEGVYRDGKGGVWHDKAEEMEYVHLLSFEEEWLLTSPGSEETSPSLGNAMIVRASSPYTNAYCPLDIITTIRHPPTSYPSSTASSPPSRSNRQTRPLLTVPSRPRPTRHHCASHPHLTNPASFILDLNLDAIDAFLPSPTRAATVPSIGGTTPSGRTRIKQHCRPRPAPLNLTTAQSSHARANAKVVLHQLKKTRTKKEEALLLEEARRAFVEDSFKPVAL